MEAIAAGVTLFDRSLPFDPCKAGFAWSGSLSTMTKYYYAGTQRIALRTGGSANTNLKWLLGDHLGSTSVTANYAGTLISRTLYKPWGEVRYQSGALPTQYTYTGQYSHTSDFGLMYYVARWYDPVLGRFAQADSLVPGMFNPMAFDRYSYVFNSPLNYIDPSGHGACNQRVKVPECVEEGLADEKGRVVLPGVRGKELEQWEVLLLTIAVMGEVMGGEYSNDLIAMIAWTYLNRLAYGSHDSLYEALKGVQSALDAYAGPKGLFPMNRGESPEAYVARFFKWADITSEAWDRVYSIVKNAYQDWLAYGADSTVDPTNGATDFRAKRLFADIPRQEGVDWCNNDSTCSGLPVSEQNVMIDQYILSLSYESAMSYHAWQSKTVPGWMWYKVGPMTLRGVTHWIFFDNRSNPAVK